MDQTEQKPDRNATKSEIWNRSRPTTLNKPRKREAVNNLKRKRKKRGVCWRREGVVVITKWWKQRKGDVKNERRGRWSWKKLWGRFSHICRRKSKKALKEISMLDKKEEEKGLSVEEVKKKSLWEVLEDFTSCWITFETKGKMLVS